MSIPGLYIFYLIKIEDFRDFILEDLYGISPCTVPPIDTITDVAFEYSIIANILLVRTSDSNKISKTHPKGCCLCWLHTLAVVTMAGDVPRQHCSSHLPCSGHVHHPRASHTSEYEPLLRLSSNKVFGAYSTYSSGWYWIYMAGHQVTKHRLSTLIDKLKFCS